MKVKRLKKAEKNLRFYRLNFGFDKPFKVLVDGTFCHAALENQINIREQMTKYLDDSEIRLFTSRCVIRELEQLGAQLGGPLHIVKQFQPITCRHKAAPTTASDCLLAAVKDNNAEKLFVATQDRNLRAQLKELGSVPLVYLYNRTMVLDKPSEASRTSANGRLETRINFEGVQKTSLEGLKKAAGLIDTAMKKRRRKGPKGPNPLSCKKPLKKRLQTVGSSDATATKKRIATNKSAST